MVKNLIIKKIFLYFILTIIILIFLRFLIIQPLLFEGCKISYKPLVGLIIGVPLFLIYYKFAIPFYYKNVSKNPILTYISSFGMGFIFMGGLFSVSSIFLSSKGSFVSVSIFIFIMGIFLLLLSSIIKKLKRT